MNSIQKLGTSALLAAASAYAFTTWYGDEKVYRVDTGLDVGTETSGYWFSYADDSDGGKSSVTWPVDRGNEESEEALDPIIDYCQGVCGTFTLSKGSLTYNPFVGIGFNVAGEDEAGTATVTDATDMGGVCIAYSVDVAAALEMGLGDAGDAEIGYDNPYVYLSKSATGVVKEFTWEKFGVGWGCPGCTGEVAAKKLVSLKFKIQGADGTTGSFNIMSIGAYGGGCKITSGSNTNPGVDYAMPTIDATPLNVQLLGRTLSFSRAVDQVEVVNLQGQTVMKANSVKTMDLSKVQAGVYMVRAGGISKRIMVK